jgi:Helix-turn-helix domain
MASNRGLSHKQKAELWRRWKAGECTADIARGLEVPGYRVSHVLCASGGIAPAVRRRASSALRAHEREEISRGIAARRSARCIAAQLGRAASTITREINRNGGRAAYRASPAEVGSRSNSQRTPACGCPTKRYIGRCLCKPVAL